MIDYLLKRVESMFSRRDSQDKWGLYHQFHETYEETEERRDFEDRKSLNYLTFDDALKFAQSLQHQVVDYAKAVARSECKSVRSELERTKDEFERCKQEVIELQKRLTHIETEAFVDSLVDRIKRKQI